MWLGEQITSKGVGNGISLLIFVGIVSKLPSAITSIWGLIMPETGFSTVGLLTALGIIIGAILLIAGVVFVQQAERRVPVQYSKRVVGRKMVGAQNTHIPLKLAMAGVMPVIFASSFMTFPAMIIQIFVKDIANQTGFLAGLYKFSIATSTTNVPIGYTIGNAIVYFPAMIIQIFVKDIANQTGFLAGLYKFSIATSTTNVPIGYTIGNAIVYLLLILGFTFFYTYATFNPAEVSNNIKKNGGFIPGIRAGKPTTEYLSSIISKLTKKNGGFIPGIRAGKPTTEYLSSIISKLTFFGGLFLAVIAILPMLLRFTNLNIAFGGTSILIVVGVALETVQQLESFLAKSKYCIWRNINLNRCRSCTRNSSTIRIILSNETL